MTAIQRTLTTSLLAPRHLKIATQLPRASASARHSPIYISPPSRRILLNNMTTAASPSHEPSTSSFASSSAPATPPNGDNVASSSRLANLNGNSSGLSLPDSPTSILAGTKSGRPGARSVPPTPTPYEAPPIPRSWRESLSAWLKTSDSAAPELFLYKDTGYFTGASLNNARNADLATAFAEVRTQGTSNAGHDEHKSSASQAQAHLKAALSTHQHHHSDAKMAAAAVHDLGRATVGTQLAPDGKVGSIRKVDIGTPAPKGFTSWFTSHVPRLINMLEIGTPRPEAEIRADEKEEKVVLLHGYGAGTSFFFQNIKALAQHPSSRLYALDWLGMGRSSRVPFHITSKEAKTTETRVEAAESFFVQALEDWRKAMGVRKMTLIGHSLGGYLSVAYALKFPENVSRLVLVSPAGIPESPDAAAEGQKAKSRSPSPSGPVRRSSQLSERDLDQAAQKIAAEVQQPQDETTPNNAAQEVRDARRMARAASSSGNLKRSAPSSAEATDAEADAPKDNVPRPPRISKRRRDIVNFLWERNLSPFAILRGSLLFGPMMAGSYTSRRFGSLPDAELRALHAYCYAVFTERGSSEYCLGHLLAPFGYARLPLVHRITALPQSMPVTFIYGARGIDWMSIDGGEEAVRRLRAAGNPNAHCFSVPHSGHHVYLDNPRAFDALLGRVLAGEADRQ